MRTAIAVLMVAVASHWMPAADQNAFIGAEGCRSCHPKHVARQSVTGHAHSLYRVAEHPMAAGFVTPDALERPPNFHLSMIAAGSGWRLRGDDGRHVTEVPVEWAFGAGDHAITFLSKVAQDFYLELALSYFSDVRTFDLTPRHDQLPCRTLNEAMGQVIRTRSAGVTCFGCHSTGPVGVSATEDMQVTERGVRCEACHGPGSAHRTAVLTGKKDEASKLIGNPGRLQGAALNDFCGRCHRVNDNLTAIDWESPWSVRQPPFLARSRCFQVSAGKLSCISCHSVHDPVRRNDAVYYRERCLACHGTGRVRPEPVCVASLEPDCVKCHMPAVAAGPHLRFVNHWIGVYPQPAVRPRRSRPESGR